MKTIFWNLIVVILGFSACDKTRTSPAEDLSALHNRFHGKYTIVTSTSDESIDVNLDGTVSENMLSEIQDLENANLEIRIYENKTPLLIQFWPEQYFDGIQPLTYDSTILLSYLKQGFDRLFKFNSDITQINVYPDKAPVPDSIHFPFPNSVSIETDDLIKVIVTKQLFTRSGWKQVKITTLYKRFTSET